MEQGMVESLVSQVLLVNSAITQVIGTDPMLIVAVVSLVSALDWIFKIRKRVPNHADLILLGSCVVMSVIVSIVAIDNVENWKQISRHALVLSGMCTISYKLGKPILKYLVLKKLKGMEEKVLEE